MSFQAYLDRAEEKTGPAPQQIDDRHVGLRGSHRAASGVPRLNGVSARSTRG